MIPERHREAINARRMRFWASKKDRVAFSMPDKTHQGFDDSTKARRASLPHNLKIPAITITPSSPSPDPNHPDYPEFFEDRMYLETKNSLDIESSSTKCNNDLSSVEIGFDSASSRRQTTVDEDPESDVVMIDDSELDDSELDITPDLDDVFASAKGEDEKRSVLQYKDRNKKSITEQSTEQESSS
jgi:hypothetical protein